MFAVPQLSEAVAAKLTAIEVAVELSGRFTVILAGTFNVGAMPSATVIVWTSVEKLPAPSVALNVRVIIFGLVALPIPVEVSVTVTTGMLQLSNGGPGGSRLPSSSNTSPRVACDGFAAGTSLKQV